MLRSPEPFQAIIIIAYTQSTVPCQLHKDKGRSKHGFQKKKYLQTQYEEAPHSVKAPKDVQI